MPPQRRRYPRTEVNIVTDISITNAAQPTKDQGLFAVIGGGGALVASNIDYPIGCLLLFRFSLPDDEDEICCQGVVCNEITGRGVGVEFLGIRPQDRIRITTFAERHAPTDPGPVG